MADVKSGGEADVDLFGRPAVPLRDPRGRKSFRKSKANQEFVESASAAGRTQEHIAAELGCDPKTLRKNFSRELKSGRARIEMEIIQVMRMKMQQGNVSAARLLREILGTADAEDILKKRAGDRQAPAPGKKEQARLDASDAMMTGAWSDLTRPN